MDIKVVPTKGPDIRHAAVSAEVEDLGRRPLHRKLGARRTGVLVVQHVPTENAQILQLGGTRDGNLVARR